MMQSDSMHAEVVVPWIPRLQYRAKLGNDPDPVVNADAVSPVSSTFSSSLASTAPSTPALSERSPSPNSSLSTYRKYRQKLMASSSSSSSPSSHHLSHNNNNNAAERKPPQKRASSFLNFFIVKEPSQQALEDYQRQLRISGGASSKDRRLDTVGLTGISSAKMPPTVPKVNSKWDGVPHQLIKEKEKQKQKQKQKRNAHLQSNGSSRSLRSSGSERSGNTTTSSSALSRSSSQHQEPPPSSSLAAGQLKSHNSASSTLSDLYGWESGSGSIISISGAGTGGGDGNSPEGGKKIKYRSKQKLPRKNASYLQAPPPLAQNVPDQYLEQDLSDLGALLGPPTAQSASPHPDVDKPSGCSPNSVTRSSTTPCPDEPLDPSFSSKEAFTLRSRPSPLALANHFPSSSSSSSNNNRTIIPKTRTTPSPPPAAPEKNEMMIHPTIIDQAIAPWVHPRYNSPPTAPVYQNQKKKFVRGIFSGK